VIFTITGTLGTGANWQVYAGSTKLSTQPTITSNSFTISNIPAATSYSVKAEGGTCDNASSPPTSNSVAIAINQPSTTPTLAANVTSVCAPGSVIFTITGTLGTGANWQVYAGSTKLSTQPTITSNSFTISNISAATSYSVKAEGGTCDNASSPPTSNSLAIAINQSSTTPTLAANITSICPPGSVAFTITGTLGTGANWKVYAGGTKLSTQPTITSNGFTISNISVATSYSVKAEGGSCDNASSPPTSNSVAIVLTSYNVTFNANGGSPVPSVQPITCNSTATAPTQSPSKTGYNFVGWFIDTSNSSAFNFSTPITAAITLNAKWVISPPAAPTLISPSHNALDVSVGIALNWNNVTNAQTYAVQVSKNSSFSGTPIANATGLTATTYNLTGLSNSTKYYWKVSAINTGGQGPATIDSFTTLITWSAVTSGLNGCGNVITFTSGGSYVFAGADAGIYRSSDNGATWTLVDNAAPSVTSMATNGSYIFAANGYLYSSSNNGNGWENLQPGSDNVECIAASNTALYLRDRSDDVYASTDNGTTWNNGYYAYPSGKIQSLCANGNSLFAGTGGGVYVSTDTGNTWKLCIAGVSSGLTISNGILYAGGSSGISYSTDNGSHWSVIGPSLANFESITCISASGNKIVTTTAGHCYFSPNNGQSWTSSNLVSGNYYNSCIISGGYILICGSDGISRSPLP
jgi:uncharacterized repeat protein (TIGR02543 family)